MYIVKNPAKSRPLSANVRRLMKMARESPLNPNVEKIEREFTARDLAYCDMQGNIFMAAIDQGITMRDFAPIFMNSQLAGVIDYSFSRAGGMNLICLRLNIRKNRSAFPAELRSLGNQGYGM